MFGSVGQKYGISEEIEQSVINYKELLMDSERLFNVGEDWEETREKANKVEKEILYKLGYKRKDLPKYIILFPHSTEWIRVREA